MLPVFQIVPNVLPIAFYACLPMFLYEALKELPKTQGLPGDAVRKDNKQPGRRYASFLMRMRIAKEDRPLVLPAATEKNLRQIRPAYRQTLFLFFLWPGIRGQPGQAFFRQAWKFHQ